ncbi:hypothetical protein OS493_030887 [Desmophyllum pertusum]|uniref:Uncharacterized protein n=1 Tax=Desmophyllum pertusum TaxID=174260 RepID=A0A9W9Y8N3_9CNID|nr:hypothetical protein OS493_030887 [Desmophyllum pertusum]
MASEEGGNIDELKKFKRRCLTFLTKVKVPARWKGSTTAFKLHKDHETYRYRENLLRIFIGKKESEGFALTHDSQKQFFEELECFSNSAETRITYFSEKRDKNNSSPTVYDLFGQGDVKLQGVVVRKTDQNAWVLVEKECVPSRKIEQKELILDLQARRDEDDFSTGFPLKEGDILEVTECKRGTETALEPDVISCYYLCESEINAFLEHMLKVLQSDGSTAAVTELIIRCHAAWDYTLQLSKEQCNNQIAQNVLYIIDKICSSAQGPMPQGVEEIVQQFAKSAFFKSILPNVVENTAKESCSSQSFKMLQNILEHVLTVSPASGPRVLPMAKVLASSLVKNSRGQSAIDFMEKLSMTIAIEVPGVHTDLEALSWRELPLLPVSEEIQSDTCRIETNDLPVIREEGKYQSEEEYLNTYFRLLREECFHKLRKGISEFTKKGKCDSKDVMIYRIALKGLSTLHREYSPTTMSIELEFKLDSQERIDWGSTSWHMFGNLLCISFDESFEHPVWAMVENVKLSEGQRFLLSLNVTT